MARKIKEEPELNEIPEFVIEESITDTSEIDSGKRAVNEIPTKEIMLDNLESYAVLFKELHGEHLNPVYSEISKSLFTIINKITQSYEAS